MASCHSSTPPQPVTITDNLLRLHGAEASEQAIGLARWYDQGVAQGCHPVLQASASLATYRGFGRGALRHYRGLVGVIRCLERLATV